MIKIASSSRTLRFDSDASHNITNFSIIYSQVTMLYMTTLYSFIIVKQEQTFSFLCHQVRSRKLDAKYNAFRKMFRSPSCTSIQYISFIPLRKPDLTLKTFKTSGFKTVVFFFFLRFRRGDKVKVQDYGS